MLWWRTMRSARGREIAPEDIFLDSSNLPQLNATQLEGRVERPVSSVAILLVGLVFAVVMTAFTAQAFNLQVVQGGRYADISRNNRLDRSVLFATRGIVTDREGTELAWNELDTDPNATTTAPYALRHYIDLPGFANLLGFVRYPKADSSGTWWREEYSGVTGIEGVFNSLLAGENGSSMAETDARGSLVREDIVDPPQDGTTLKLSIDADLQTELARRLEAHADAQGFQGGAGAIMDVRTGELVALVSFPEYDNTAFANGDSAIVAAVNADPRTPLLNRAIGGLYAPGSIVKPMFASAALNEHLIDPEKEILSTGSISIPNPYDPSNPSIFKDWKAHGWVDMRRAIAVSSDVYFYAIGGGFADQKGLGIAKIDEYAKKFGFSAPTGFVMGGEPGGTIPTPEWKQKVFEEDWRLGDTYHTAIGQYGFQVTPLQVVRYIASIANGGTLMTPQIVAGAKPEGKSVGIKDSDLEIVREGMRAGVTDGGTAAAMNMGGIDIAGKTGTAQIGTHNQYMNSWAVGFWPYENPRYAFAVVLEKGPSTSLSGASPAMAPFLQWLRDTKPEYVK
jgi:penicillin-binding protein 2